MYLNAEFTDSKAVADAVRALGSMGLSKDQIELFSTKPSISSPACSTGPAACRCSRSWALSWGAG